MMRKYGGWAMLTGIALCSGCVDTGILRATHGRTVLKAFESAVTDATKDVEQGLVVIKIKTEQAKSRQMGMFSFGDAMGGSSGTLNGLVLTKAGHILVPKLIKPEQTKRMEVWIGEKEYTAKFVKADEQMGMSVVKIDTEDLLYPIELSTYEDLAIGQWGIVVEAGDEITDYKKLKRLTFCSSTIDDFYRQFILDSQKPTSMLGSVSPDGALLLNTQGKIAAIQINGKMFSLADLHEGITELVADATAEKKQNEEEKKKAWFGLVTDMVNKEYALSKNLPSSSLWVAYVFTGSPAEAAGVKQGDLITGFNGKPLRLKGARVAHYFAKAVRPKEGKPFSITVLRNGVRKELAGTYTKRPEEETLRAQDLGLTVKNTTDEDAFMRNLSVKTGVLVKDVEKGSPAATSGSFRQSLLYPNDVIVEMAGKPTPTIAEFSSVVESLRSEKPSTVLVKFQRGIVTGYAALNLSKNK
jgi:serine protease Do